MTLEEAIELAIERAEDGCGTCNACTGCSGCKDVKDEFEAIAKFITELKERREHPEVRRGRWKCIGEYEEFSEEMADYFCENCGYVISRLKNQKPKFCEGCGARMDLYTPTDAALDIADSVMMGGDDNG